MRSFFLQKKYFAYLENLVKMIKLLKKPKAFLRSLKTCIVLNRNHRSNPPQSLQDSNQPLKPNPLLLKP